MTGADGGPRFQGAALVLALVGALATSTGLGNRFAQDDLSLIFSNRAVHTMRDPARFWTEPYWNDPFPAALYRPLASTTHALQWNAGGGRPLVFRLTSTGFLIAAGLAFFGLASLVLPKPLALATAAVFLAHPVHVEATAVAVNQGELAVAALACFGAAWYVRARRRGVLAARDVAVLAASYLVACLFKEHGLVLPVLLLGAEFTIVADPRPVRERLAELRPVYLLLALVGVLVIAARTAVLGGDAVGTPPAEALADAGFLRRGMIMLGVVPEWLRLLFWPTHLQADYGPGEIAEGAHWGFLQWLGLGLIALWAATIPIWRSRRPLLAFSLVWIAVGLFPVSNVLVPTGVILAERTLFLASAGAMLLVGGLLDRQTASYTWRRTAVAVLALMSVLGIWRSADRGRDWRDQKTLLHQTVVDAPRSYGAHLSLARFLSDSGSAAEAELHFRDAATIEPALVAREKQAGDRFRAAGYCRPAVRRYRLPLLIRPDDSSVRAAMVTCLLDLGRFAEARRLAEPGLRDPATSEFFRQATRRADSALAGALKETRVVPR